MLVRFFFYLTIFLLSALLFVRYEFYLDFFSIILLHTSLNWCWFEYLKYDWLAAIIHVI